MEPVPSVESAELLTHDGCSDSAAQWARPTEWRSEPCQSPDSEPDEPATPSGSALQQRDDRHRRRLAAGNCRGPAPPGDGRGGESRSAVTRRSLEEWLRLTRTAYSMLSPG